LSSASLRASSWRKGALFAHLCIFGNWHGKHNDLSRLFHGLFYGSRLRFFGAVCLSPLSFAECSAANLSCLFMNIHSSSFVFQARGDGRVARSGKTRSSRIILAHAGAASQKA
jgi:hypothetical protein